jgi:hypothetical protein
MGVLALMMLHITHTFNKGDGMKGPKYTFSCNLLVEPPKVDRFYMDMRVYSVSPDSQPQTGDDSRDLVWRGIYLAFEVGSVEQQS